MYVTANGNPCEAPAASPVIQNSYPQWFIERMHGVSDPHLEPMDELNLLRRLAKTVCNDTTWIDHEGTAIVADKELFVSEPYLRPFDDLSCAEEIARLLDCDLFVATYSYWFPGKTIRLKFRPKGSDWDVDAWRSDDEAFMQKGAAAQGNADSKIVIIGG